MEANNKRAVFELDAVDRKLLCLSTELTSWPFATASDLLDRVLRFREAQLGAAEELSISGGQRIQDHNFLLARRASFNKMLAVIASQSSVAHEADIFLQGRPHNG